MNRLQAVSRLPWATALCSALACVAPSAVHAHAFAAPYTLPVPFWMYAYGASAALVVSFVIVGIFASASGERSTALAPIHSVDSQHSVRPVPQTMVTTLRAIALLLLVLCVTSGLMGTSNPFLNINMTMFWIVFVLGLTYATALVGDIFAFANPWRTLCEGAHRAGLLSCSGRVAYPPKLASYPALLLYLVFIWVELFGHTTPLQLSIYLLGYTLLTLFFSWLFGICAWFRHGEFFSLFFRLVGLMAPVEYRTCARRGVECRLRLPLSGLLQRQPVDTSLVLFVLFILASTAFDGAHETQPWSRLFWRGVYPWIEPTVVATSVQPYTVAARLYYRWQWLMLALSPLLYFCLYAGFIALSRHVSGSTRSTRELGQLFAQSLLPIAFVYHLTHYYTLLPAQGLQLIKLISDPLGWGWDLFGTARIALPPILLDASVIWHSQVALILAGHIASVFIAHMEALRVFPSQRSAVASQIPMLLLMVGLTAGGLWILSLPMGSG